MIAAIPVSVGEVIDKITILEIKAQRIADPAKHANVIAELAALNAVATGLDLSPDVAAMKNELWHVNCKLWDVEDKLREAESASDFGPKFVQLARSVYFLNDNRAAIKRRISVATGSVIVEEKSYG
jgi:hypothetical protein